jgi:acyl dehydratase
MRIFTSPDQLKSAISEDLGTSDWLHITQERIDTFADATGDHQWIHVDVERATHESPFGAPIAHGFLSLSLVSLLNWQIYTIENTTLAINYGLNRVRFVNPVKVEAHVRLRTTLNSVGDAPGGALQIVTTNTLEIAGEEKPALVAETVGRIIF